MAANANVLTKRVAKEWKKQHNNDLTDSNTALGINRDATINYDNDGSIIKIFAEDDPVRHLFTYQDANNEIQLPKVQRGEILGMFSSFVGFEIYTQRLGFESKLKLVRKTENYVSVGSINDPLDQNNTWLTQDEVYFTHWHEKEACLTYVDPCAFFGAFVEHRLFIQTGYSKSKVKGQDIWKDVLQETGFFNKETIYLDIRNDLHFSLTYFKNYSAKITFQFGNPAVVTSLNFNRNWWPIMQIKLSEIENSGSVHNGLFKTNLVFPIHQNLQNPVIFISKGYVNKIGRLKRKQRVPHVMKHTFTQKMSPFPVAFSTYTDNGIQGLASNYYKINVYDRGRLDNNQAIDFDITKNHYLSSLFRPTDMKLDINFSGNNFRFKIWHEELLVNMSADGGPTYVAYVGIAEDTYNTTLFAYPAHFINGSGGNFSIPHVFTNWTEQDLLYPDGFIDKILLKIGLKKIKKQPLALQVDGSIEQVDTVVFENYPFGFLENNFRKNETPEDYLFIPFQKQEYNLMVNDVLNTPPAIINWVFIKHAEKKNNDDGYQYSKIDLAIEGLVIGGSTVNKIDILPNVATVFENQIFSGQFGKIVTPYTDDLQSDVSKLIRRLSTGGVPNKKSWKLYDLQGIQKKYLEDEKNHFGANIGNTEILLPVGTRTVKLGDCQLNGSDYVYIVCYHNQGHREGLVDKNAFTNSEPRTNNTDVSTVSDEVLVRPFLDDAEYILFFCHEFTNHSDNKISSTYKDIIGRTARYLSRYKKGITDNLNYTYAAQQIRLLYQELFVSVNTNSIRYDLSDTAHSYERFKTNFSPLTTLLTELNDKFYVVPLTYKWLDDNRTIPPLATKRDFTGDNDTTDPSDVSFVEYMDRQQTSGNTASFTGYIFVDGAGVNEATATRNALLDLKAYYSQINNPLDLEGQWIKNSMDNDAIASAERFVFLEDVIWMDTDVQKNIFSSDVKIDNSIGFINNPTPLSVILHELNTGGIFVDSDYFLFYDTHGLDKFTLKTKELIHLLLKGESFDSFLAKQPFTSGSYETREPWAFGTSPHMSVLYLDHYLRSIFE